MKIKGTWECIFPAGIEIKSKNLAKHQIIWSQIFTFWKARGINENIYYLKCFPGHILHVSYGSKNAHKLAVMVNIFELGYDKVGLGVQGQNLSSPELNYWSRIVKSS